MIKAVGWSHDQLGEPLMKSLFAVALALITIFATLFAFTVFQNARSAIHEIEALISAVIATMSIGMLYVGACVRGKL